MLGALFVEELSIVQPDTLVTLADFTFTAVLLRRVDS